MSTRLRPLDPVDRILPGINRGTHEISSSRGINMAWVLIVGVIMLGLFIALIWYAIRGEGDQPLDPPPLTPKDPVKSTIGSSDNGVVDVDNGSFFTDAVACRKGPTRRWGHSARSSIPTCSCAGPFFGSQCERESYDSEYIAIGSPDIGDLEITPISVNSVDRLSFRFSNPEHPSSEGVQSLCTDLCDQEPNCIGVIYEQAESPDFGIGQDAKPQCTLLSGGVTLNPGAQLPYSVDQDSTLYLKPGNRVRFEGRVFLYKGDLPLRYWLNDRFTGRGGEDRTWAAYHLTQYNLDFVPTNIINDTGSDEGEPWVGVFANEEIPLDNLKQIIEAGTTARYIIVDPGQDGITLPSSWSRPYTVWVDASTIDVMMSVMDSEPTATNSTGEDVDSSNGTMIIPQNGNQCGSRGRSGAKRKRSYMVEWNKGNKLSNMKIRTGDAITFLSKDGLFHGIDITGSSSRSYPISTKLRQSITFNRCGKYIIKDRVYSRNMKISVVVRN